MLPPLETVIHPNEPPRSVLLVMRDRAVKVLRETEGWLDDVEACNRSHPALIVATPAHVLQMRGAANEVARYINEIDARLAKLPAK